MPTRRSLFIPLILIRDMSLSALHFGRYFPISVKMLTIINFFVEQADYLCYTRDRFDVDVCSA